MALGKQPLIVAELTLAKLDSSENTFFVTLSVVERQKKIVTNSQTNINRYCCFCFSKNVKWSEVVSPSSQYRKSLTTK